MKFLSQSFEHQQEIPSEFAFGKHNPESHVELSSNRNPHFSWGDLPEGTQSLVLICVDDDVPSKPDDVNQEGKTVPKDLPRVDFYHWSLVDIPPSVCEIAAGEYSSGITPKGKPGPQTSQGTRQGMNNYTQWFAGDKDMEGNYFGYDGPCPPWNDSIMHHYHFSLYALDVEKCPVKGEFTGQDAAKACEGHILAKATVTGLYRINPSATLN